MAHNGNYNNMRTAIHNIANAMYNSYFNGRIYHRFEWHVAANERGLVGCSKDVESKECTLLQGATRFYNWYLTDKISYKLSNRYLNGNHPDRYYYMLALNPNFKPEAKKEEKKDDKKEEKKSFAQLEGAEEVVRVNLTRNWGSATSKFNSLCHKDPKQNKKYQTCIILSTASNGRWTFHTTLTGHETYQDLYHLLAKNMRKMVPDEMTKTHNDEQSLKIKTKSEWNKFLNEKKEALRKLYSGDNDQTARRELYRLAAYDKYAVNF